MRSRRKNCQNSGAWPSAHKTKTRYLYGALEWTSHKFGVAKKKNLPPNRPAAGRMIDSVGANSLRGAVDKSKGSVAGAVFLTPREAWKLTRMERHAEWIKKSTLHPRQKQAHARMENKLRELPLRAFWKKSIPIELCSSLLAQRLCEWIYIFASELACCWNRSVLDGGMKTD